MLSVTEMQFSPLHDENSELAGAVYETIGKLTSLLAHSSMHSHFTVKDIADILMPPIILNQYRIYSANNATAVGFVCWGMFSPDVERKLVHSKSVLELSDWTSGNQPFVTDFIAPFGHAKMIVRDLKTGIFADHVVKALRYESPGNPRRSVSRFYGVNALK